MKKHVSLLKHAAVGIVVIAVLCAAVVLAAAMELAKLNDCRAAGHASIVCLVRSLF